MIDILYFLLGFTQCDVCGHQMSWIEEKVWTDSCVYCVPCWSIYKQPKPSNTTV